MESVLFIILIGLIGGVAVGLQSPMASMISQRLGTLESVFIVHLGGAILSLVPLLLFYGGGKLPQWKSVPWYVLGAGVFGLAVIGAISYMIPRVGCPFGGRVADSEVRAANQSTVSEFHFAACTTTLNFKGKSLDTPKINKV